jgi:hypothetical protein
MLDWATVLTSALDEVGYGIVLLDKDLQARFINRAFHRMWARRGRRPARPTISPT